jgi:hypothetical protein
VPKPPSDLTTLSDLALDALFSDLKAEIAAAQALLDERPSPRKKAFRIVRSTLLNFTGLALSPPTGGLSALLCVVGLWEWAEMMAEDAETYNRDIELNKIRRSQDELLSTIAAEYARRGRSK